MRVKAGETAYGMSDRRPLWLLVHNRRSGACVTRYGGTIESVPML